MPRAARYQTPTFEELERQLAFAPPEALRRQMEAAERLMDDIEDNSTYPFEFVLWRLTGFRTADTAIKRTPSKALRSDLVTFVLHLSERLGLSGDERPGGAVSMAELASELGVAEKTLRRWRARGLLCHRVTLPDGRNRVAIYRSELERFVQRNPGLLESAAGFTRLDDTTTKTALAKARELVAGGLTPNKAAKVIAEEIGRSHETVRQLLLRTAEKRPSPLGRAVRSDGAGRDRRLAYRAWLFGVDVERIAARSGATPDAIRRRIDTARAERLRAARFSWVEYPTFDRPDAEATILAAPSVNTDLAPHHDPPEAIAMLESLAAARSSLAQAEANHEATDDAMLAAYNLLKRIARRRIETLGRSPDRLSLDVIETDLLWALRIKRRMVERWLPSAVLRVEQTIGGPLLRRPAEEIRGMLEQCVKLVESTAENADSAKRQSARRLIAFETDRLLAKLGLGSRSARASVRHERGSLPMPKLFDGLVPWTALVDPLASRRSALGRLPQADAALLAARFGWSDGPPQTLERLAAGERTTVARISRRLMDAERALRIASRQR